VEAGGGKTGGRRRGRGGTADGDDLALLALDSVDVDRLIWRPFKTTCDKTSLTSIDPPPPPPPPPHSSSLSPPTPPPIPTTSLNLSASFSSSRPLSLLLQQLIIFSYFQIVIF